MALVFLSNHTCCELEFLVLKCFIAVLLIGLVVLHQDYWQWNDTTLVFGLSPRTLIYHIGLSLGAAGVWWLAVRFCWPESSGEER